VARAPIALPNAEISADWSPRQGRFLQHPAGLVEGIRPEWDQVRARRARLAAGAPPIVQTPRRRSADALRNVARRVRRFLESIA